MIVRMSPSGVKTFKTPFLLLQLLRLLRLVLPELHAILVLVDEFNLAPVRVATYTISPRSPTVS
jgi:hypothetical protein